MNLKQLARVAGQLCSLTALTAIVMGSVTAQETYIITDLGTLPGYTAWSQANAISATGEVIGISVNPTNNNDAQGFLWKPSVSNGTSGKMIPVPRLGGSATAWGINASGEIVGYSYLNNTLPQHYAFCYTDGLLFDLGTLGGYYSAAEAINDSGDIVGYSDLSNNSTYHAILYTEGVMQDLGTLPGFFSSQATSINNSSEIVGIAGTTSGIQHPFLYTNGSMTDLGTLPGDTYAQAYHINAIGQIVGISADSSNNDEAFLWNPILPNGTTGTMTSLGILPGCTYSGAIGINDSGEIVGACAVNSTITNTYRAFLFQKGVMLDLNDVLPANSGWTLFSATSINNDGQIVGWGSIKGQSHAYLLTPIHVHSLSPVNLTVLGGTTITWTVTLNVAAPTGGVLVTLHNTNPDAVAPASVTIPAGHTSETFTVTTGSTTVDHTGTITASFNNSSVSQSLTVRPIQVSSLTLSPNPVVSGAPVLATVTLESAASPAAITVTIASSNPGIAEPYVKQVTITKGQTSAHVWIATARVLATEHVTITATADGKSVSQTLTINP